MIQNNVHQGSTLFVCMQFARGKIRGGTLILFALATSAVVSAASGEFDSSFGQAGIVQFSADA